jgi:hypothetical protein
MTEGYAVPNKLEICLPVPYTSPYNALGTRQDKKLSIQYNVAQHGSTAKNEINAWFTRWIKKGRRRNDSKYRVAMLIRAKIGHVASIL